MAWFSAHFIGQQAATAAKKLYYTFMAYSSNKLCCLIVSIIVWNKLYKLLFVLSFDIYLNNYF